MIDHVGQQFGNYRLIRLLGRGGSADTYLAEQMYIKTFAAVKILQVQVNEGDEKGFYQNARTIARLNHPNIVRVLDFGSAHTTFYLVMDYAPNGTLRQLYRRGTVLPLQMIVPYVKQIAAALQYAHGQGVVHRDVKPENMLLSEDEDVLLSDFGAAFVQGMGAHSKLDVAGTVTYMAPEQIRGMPCPASDQYALGIVVYEWLCGVPPFSGSQVEVALQHERERPARLRKHIPSISSEVERIVLKALAKDPEQRFATIQDFADALEEAARKVEYSDAPLQSSPAGMYVPIKSPGGSNQANGHVQADKSWVATRSAANRLKLLALVLLALLVTVGGVLTFFFAAYVPDQERKQAAANALIVQATSTAESRAIKQQTAQVQATVTARQTLYDRTASEPPTIAEPLKTGSGYGWDNATTYMDRNNRPIGSCTYAGNAYHVRAGSNYIIRCLAEATNFQNFMCQITITIVRGHAGGLVLHADANGNGYYFGIGTDGTYILQKLIVNDNTGDTSLIRLVSGTSAAIYSGNNQTNLLGVVVQGFNIYTYINKQYVDASSDSTYISGRVGVYADGDTGDTEVVARNAQMWQWGH